MSEQSVEILLGKVLADLETLKTDVKQLETTLRKHEDVFSFLKGSRMVLVWIGALTLAVFTAMGFSINKFFMWLASLR